VCKLAAGELGFRPATLSASAAVTRDDAPVATGAVPVVAVPMTCAGQTCDRRMTQRLEINLPPEDESAPAAAGARIPRRRLALRALFPEPPPVGNNDEHAPVVQLDWGSSAVLTQVAAAGDSTSSRPKDCARHSHTGALHCADLESLLSGWYETWARAHRDYDAARRTRGPTTEAELRAEQEAEKLAGAALRERRAEYEAEARRMTRTEGLRPLYMPIFRMDASELSVERFRREFAGPRRAVILRGLGDVVNTAGGSAWNVSFWSKECGEAEVQPVKHQPKLKTWGSHATFGRPLSLREFLSSSSSSSSSSKAGVRLPTTAEEGISNNRLSDGGYVADWSLQRGCGRGAWQHSFRIPKYFTEDFFQSLPGTMGRERERLSPRDSWPSLFIGSNRSSTGLHADWAHSHFWMLVISGSKEWVVFPEQMAPFLYKGWSRPHFPVNPWRIQRPASMEQRPLTAAVRGFHGVAVAGDVIFIPAGTVHAVRNRGRAPTVALSMNYIDRTNVEAAVDDLLSNTRTADDRMYGQALARAAKVKASTLAPAQAVPFAEFKGWEPAESKQEL
jgi:hypothetical protein